MSLGPQYTSCVEAKDFEPIKEWYVGILIGAAAGGAIAALFSGGIGLLVTIPALVEALHYVSNWMLNEKLICFASRSIKDVRRPRTCLGNRRSC